MSFLFDDPSTHPPLSAYEIFWQRQKIPFIPTFSDKLNSVLGGGFRATGTYVLTGAPGSGKTTWTLSVADHAMLCGYPVIYVSAELPPQLLLDRLVCRKLGMGWLNVVDLNTSDPNDPDYEENRFRYEQAITPYADKLYVIGPEQARHWQTHVKYARKQIDEAAGFHVPVLVIMDYLQDLAQILIAQGKDPRVAVSELSREIRSMAQSEFCPFLIISATSRQFYNGDEEVNDAALIASAKESGEVEYNVNAALYLRKRDFNKKPHSEVVVCKNRFGENPVSIVYSTNPVTGEFHETNWSGQEAETAGVIIQIYELVKANPGKYMKAATIAKTLNHKAADVAAAIDAMVAGVGPYKITFGLEGHEGYFALPEQAVEVLS